MTARQSSWAAAALYVVLTFLLAYPLSVTANRTLPSDDPDGHLFMWTLAWDTHAFVHQPLSIFDANIFYPNRDSLAYSENLIGSAFFAAPVLWLTGNPVLAVNVVSLLSCVLCGLGAYVLGRRVGLSVAAAVLTGLVFAFSPPRFFRFSQLHLTAVQWIPFALASLHSYLEGGKKRDLRLAIAFFTLQVMASGHGGVFAAVAIVLMLAYRLALGEPVLFMRRLRDVGIAGTLLLVPVVLFAIPYRVAQLEVGLRRDLASSETPLQDFVASPTRVDAFLQSLITSRDINGAATAWLFPGFLPLLLALVAIVVGITHLWRSIRLKPDPTGYETTGYETWIKRASQHRLLFLACAIAVLSWAALGVARPLLRAGDGLTAQSYPDGRTVWTGYLSIGQSGRYNFGVTSDDDTRLSIDSMVIIDRRASQPGAPTAGTTPLAAGSHRILLEYARPAERAAFNLVWSRQGDGSNYQSMPSWALSRRPTSPAAVLVIRALEWLRLASTIAMILSLAGWLAGRRAAGIAWGAEHRRSPTAFYLVLTIASAGLALGGRYWPWQFVYWLPGFNFIRGPSRFMVLGLLGVAVLAGVGFDRLTARLGAVPRRLAAVVVGVLLVAEFSAIPYNGVAYRLDIPAVDLWVARQQKPFSIVEVPVTTSERYHSNYMLHSMAHWQKTVNGYSGIRPALHEELYDQLRTFPSEDSVRHLAQLHVTYVIVHSSWFPPEERRLVEERLPAFGSLKLEYMDQDSRVYSIQSPSRASKGAS
jgi:PA14 domain-containing protein